MNENYGNSEAKVARLSSLETTLQMLDKCVGRSDYLASAFNDTLQILENRPEEPVPSPENYIRKGEQRLSGQIIESKQKDRIQTLQDMIHTLGDNLTRLEHSLGHLKEIV